MSFASLGLSEALVRAIEDAGYAQPTPVQQRAIPAVLEGRDLMVAAQTGTGKTGGFALPILERLFPNGHPDKSQRHGPRQPRVLVLTPTRELAAQVHDSFKVYARDLSFVSACIFGGVGMNPQVQAMAKGVDVLVACPGRLLDHCGQGTIDLSHVEILVLDEADRMLDMGFIHDVRKVLARLPAKRQNLLFSATFSKDITDLAGKLLHNPERIEVTPPNTTVERIDQCVYRLPATHKRALLAHLITEGAWEQVLVFTRTKHGANRLAEYLTKHGLSAAAIHGNKSQNARTKALADFKANEIRVLVATDIAARGLDIDQLPHVVNYELPNVEEDYVHRIGRTGRAGRSGEAVSLVAPDEEKLLRNIERITRQKVQDGDLKGFDINAVVVEKQEPRPPQEKQQRGGRNQPKKADGTEGRSGRKDKGKDKGKERSAEKASPEKAAAKPEGQGEQQRNKRKPRNRKPEGQQGQQGQGRQQQAQGSAKPSTSRDRDPEEFLDDDVDNFGNRADYVSPYANKGKGRGQGNNRGTGTGQGQPANRSQRPNNGGGSKSGGSNTGGSNSSNRGGRQQQRRDGGGQRRIADRQESGNNRPQREPQTPAVQPKIVHKESKIDRSLTPEQLAQLDQIPNRPRGERPALLTRNR